MVQLTEEQQTGIMGQVSVGNIRVQTHPELPLAIYNYSQAVQYSQEWNEYTLMCRGLIVDPGWNVIARPFSKFFNWAEWEPEKQSKYAANPDRAITTKVDGSLGIGYEWGGRWHIATRGSFASDQAIKANERLVNQPDFRFFPEGTTPLFEILAPWNRIVVPYTQEELVLIDVVDGYGRSIDIPLADMWEGSIVEQIHLDDLDALQAMETDSLEEGFVVKWSDGERAKFKFAEYVRLHKIITGTNSVRVWEALQDPQAWELLIDNTPDEFNKWVRSTANDLREQYARLHDFAMSAWRDYNSLLFESRKAFALKATKTDAPELLFALADQKDISPLIWKRLKPEATFPFAESEE